MDSASSGGKFNLSAATAAYKNMANAAPSAIRPDLEVLASAFSAYASDLAKVGFTSGKTPSTTQLAEIAAAAKEFTAPKLEAASKAIQAWAVKNCSA
jgi:hypothetical protein